MFGGYIISNEGIELCLELRINNLITTQSEITSLSIIGLTQLWYVN